MSDNVVPDGAAASDARLRFILLRSDALSRYTALAAALVVAGGYAYLLAWFTRVDFYHHDFFAHGRAVQHYEIARLVFIPYFAWTIYAVGAFANLLIFGRKTTAAFPAWERFPLFFIAGAGIWHVAMFAIGLAGFDIKPVAVALTLGTMALSVPHLAECLSEAATAISQARFRLTLSSSLTAALWLGIIAVSAVFLLVKGLYPGGGHDYYNQYFQFYKRVIETGSVLPNDVWYEFYYSKGAGLHFLGMLLTDPLAPQLVSTAFMACAACIVYALLRNATRSTLLALVGVLLYIGAFIYTPGPKINMVEGGWGIMEKMHELTAVLLLAVIWISYRLFRADAATPGPLTLALHAAIVCIALLTLPLTLLAGLYLTGYVLWFAITRQWRVAIRPFMAGVTAAFCLLAIGAINYHYTGLPLDQLVVQFWPYVDLGRIMQWGTVVELLTLYQGLIGMFASEKPISWDAVPLIATYLRLELWWPIIVLAAPFVIFQLRHKKTRTLLHERVDAPAWSALVLFAGAVVLVAIFGGGLSQKISFYRMSTFSYAPTLCLSLLLCHLALTGEIGSKVATPLRVVASSGCVGAALGIIAFLGAPAAGVVRQNLTPILLNASHLWHGRFSLKDAYQNVQGWSGTAPWGAIYPGIIEAWRIAGPRTRVWSFHIHSYCMLPDCDIDEFFSERFSPSWQTVFFGEPKKAIRALQAEGLNYFFFSSELRMEDMIAHTQLFSSADIGKYLAIRWTDGTSYLLSWPGPNTKPIDRKFLEVYANTVNNRSFDEKLWREVSNYIDRHRDHLTPFFAPWCTNCTGLEPLAVADAGASGLASNPPSAANLKPEQVATAPIPVSGIRVRSATYGANCGAPPGNATSDLQMSCDGERKCSYKVDTVRLGDPASGCAKAFAAEYECVPAGSPVKVDVPGEAGFGTSVELSCQSATASEAPPAAQWTGIRILSATYGRNCGAPIGNATSAIGGACGAKASCDYTVDVNKLRDRLRVAPRVSLSSINAAASRPREPQRFRARQVSAR